MHRDGEEAHRAAETGSTEPPELLLVAVREKHHSPYQSKKRYGSVAVRDYQSSNHRILLQHATLPDSRQTANKIIR